MTGAAPGERRLCHGRRRRCRHPQPDQLQGAGSRKPGSSASACSGIELRDLYGRLIDGSLGATGRLRTGGDGAALSAQGSPPTEKLVAFFSGPVKLDADGKATVDFDIPQFNGTVRIMAVAWTKEAVGHATQDVIVRDPVVDHRRPAALPGARRRAR